MEILQELKENHNSLCYACDYSYDNKFIITSSFYDKLLNIYNLYSIKKHNIYTKKIICINKNINTKKN